jgi:hypothetical protein
MSKIIFDNTGEKIYETGVDHCVLFVRDGNTYQTGVAWNGITAINESPSGAEATPIYADNIKYLNIVSGEDFGATIEAYTYPDEFTECDGSAEIIEGVKIGQQTRKPFALCYRTLIGNDVAGTGHGYKLHFIYNAQAAVSAKNYKTINESPEAMSFSWEISTTPEVVEGFKPTATVTVDSTKVDSTKLKALEDKIYGTESSEPTMPTISEIVSLLSK